MKDGARVKKWDSQRALKFVVVYRQAGKRQARYFKDERGAKLFAQEKTTELRNVGRKHSEFSYDERQAVLEARSRASTFGRPWNISPRTARPSTPR